MYKVTENGTLYAGLNYQQELESSIEKISEFSNISNNVKKRGNVFLCNTHHLWNSEENNPITNPNFFDDPDDDLYDNEPEIDETTARTRAAHRNITDADFESFPIMGVVKPTTVGKVLEFALNKTSYKKYRFKSNKRRKLYVSFYNKDYAFYRSSGFDVKVMKKIWYGGWGRVIHWDVGVYAGFSYIQIEHAVSVPKANEMQKFFDGVRKNHIDHSSRIKYRIFYYQLHKDGNAIYNSYPFRNDKGHRGISIPYMVDFLGDENVEILNKEIAKQLKKGIQGGENKEYSKNEKAQQYTAFNMRNNRVFYDIHENLLFFNGGGYRVRDEFFRERKSVEAGFNMKGGKLESGGLSVGKSDIVYSKVSGAQGFVYTEDGNGFIGVRITVE